jgi:hypothetical protein
MSHHLAEQPSTALTQIGMARSLTIGVEMLTTLVQRWAQITLSQLGTGFPGLRHIHLAESGVTTTVKAFKRM